MIKTFSGRPYEEIVAEGQSGVLAQTQYQWRLGDLAIDVVGPASPNEGKSQDGRLTQFAEDIGVDYRRLAQYRIVSTGWPEFTRVNSVPWVRLDGEPDSGSCQRQRPRAPAKTVRRQRYRWRALLPLGD